VAEPIDIRINARAGDISGLDHIERRIALLRSAAAGVVSAGAAPPLSGLGAYASPGPRQPGMPLPTSPPPAAPPPLAGWTVLPGGGLVRTGYAGAGGAGTYRAAAMIGMPALLGLASRPWPATLPPSPFGARGGGPPGYLPGATPPVGAFSPWHGPSSFTPPPGFGGGAGGGWAGGGGGGGFGGPGGFGGGPTPPSGPFSAWPGSWWQRTSGYAGMYASQAGAAVAGGLGGGPMGAIGRSLARVPGIALGYGAYQAVSGGLAEAEQRFRGVLEIGSILQGQYDSVNQTIIRMRDNYQILARDGRAALTTLARATGDVTGGEAALRVGRAYGFEREAPGMLASLATLGGGTPSLASMTAVYNQSVAGRARISLPRFMEQAIEIAGVGGLGARPMTDEQIAHTTAMMTLMGGRYAANPAQAYGDYFGGLQAGTSPLGESLRMTAVGEVVRQRRYHDIGDIRNVDLSTWTGQRMAMEQAGQLPFMRQAYYQQIARQSRGNEGMAVALTQEMFGIGNTAQALDLWRNLQATGGGGVPRAQMEQETANIDKALAVQKADADELRGQRLRERDAGMERLGETALIKGLQDVSIEVGKTLGRAVELWNATHDPIKTATAALDEFGQKTYATIAVMAAAAAALAGSPLLAGIALAGAGGVALEEVLRPFAVPGSPTERGIGAPSPRDPSRQGP
jgi:hypothetical protein